MGKSRQRMLLGLLLGVLFLVLAFRKVELGALAQKLSTFNFWWFPFFAACHLTSLLVRSWRWQTIVNPIRPIGVGALFPILLRGFLISNLVPMKAGDLYRFYALSQRTGLTKTTSLATLVVERLFDLTGLVLLSGLLALALPLPAGIRKAVAWSGAATLVALALWLAARKIPGLRQRLRQVELRLTRRAESASGGLGRVVESVRQGFTVLNDLRQGLTLMFLTGLLFIAYSMGVLFVLRGFGVAGVSLLAPFALMVFVFWSSALPQAPAGLGTFEYSTLLALQIFGVGREEALAVALVWHAGIILNLLVATGLLFLAGHVQIKVPAPVAGGDGAVKAESPKP